MPRSASTKTVPDGHCAGARSSSPLLLTTSTEATRLVVCSTRCNRKPTWILANQNFFWIKVMQFQLRYTNTRMQLLMLSSNIQSCGGLPSVYVCLCANSDMLGTGIRVPQQSFCLVWQCLQFYKFMRSHIFKNASSVFGRDVTPLGTEISVANRYPRCIAWHLAARVTWTLEEVYIEKTFQLGTY